MLRAVKAKNDELAKPQGERDEARLLELRKRVLRLSIESLQVGAALRQAALPGASCAAASHARRRAGGRCLAH